MNVFLTSAIIGVRCPKCALPGLLDQKPGHLCVACATPLKEHKVDNTGCSWCTDAGVCVVCAKKAHRLEKIPRRR